MIVDEKQGNDYDIIDFTRTSARWLGFTVVFPGLFFCFYRGERRVSIALYQPLSFFFEGMKI